MVNCGRDKTNKINFGEKLSNSIDTTERRSSSRYLPTVFLCGLKAPEKKKPFSCRFLTSWTTCAGARHLVQARGTTRYDREAEEPEM
jgi:hypothetical protein